MFLLVFIYGADDDDDDDARIIEFKFRRIARATDNLGVRNMLCSIRRIPLAVPCHRAWS